MTSNFLLSILTSAGVGAALSSLVLWLGKSWISERLKQAIKAEYDEKLESHKAKLKAESDVELERLRAELRVASAEHEIRFSRLHEQRADVIAKTYSLLVQSHRNFSSFVSPTELVGDSSKKEKFASAMAAAWEFYDYFDSHRIYLPAKLCEQIDGFLSGMRKKAIRFGAYVARDDSELRDHEVERKMKNWLEAEEYFAEQVPVMKDALENELRRILGESE